MSVPTTVAPSSRTREASFPISPSASARGGRSPATTTRFPARTLAVETGWRELISTLSGSQLARALARRRRDLFERLQPTSILARDLREPRESQLSRAGAHDGEFGVEGLLV